MKLRINESASMKDAFTDRYYTHKVDEINRLYSSLKNGTIDKYTTDRACAIELCDYLLTLLTGFSEKHPDLYTQKKFKDDKRFLKFRRKELSKGEMGVYPAHISELLYFIDKDIIPFFDSIGYSLVESAKIKSNKNRMTESNIPESDAEELYRIAEYELLPETQLYKISERCTIDEDTFEYTHTGTAWGGYICYDIYMEWTAEYLPRISDFYRDNIDDVWHRDWKLNEIKIDFTIHVDGDRVTVDISDMDIVEPRNFEKVFDLDALCDAIREIAENSANYIHSKIGAYEPYDMDESVIKRSRKRSSGLKENVSEKFEMQSLANDLNNINDGKSWVGIDASLYKDSNGHWRVKVDILNTNYETVMDSCDVVVSNRGGYVIHLYNPTASQWYDTKDDVLYYFERRIKSNKK